DRARRDLRGEPLNQIRRQRRRSAGRGILRRAGRPRLGCRRKGLRSAHRYAGGTAPCDAMMEVNMKRSVAILVLIGVSVTPAAADIPVIDKTNYAVARDTAEKTGKILDTNKEILNTVEETLKAVTGERGRD